MSETSVVTREGVLEVIRAHLAVRHIDVSAIVEGASFTRDLALDSLTLQTLAQELEDEFAIRIGPEDAVAMQTVGHAVDFVLAARRAKATA